MYSMSGWLLCNGPVAVQPVVSIMPHSSWLLWLIACRVVSFVCKECVMWCGVVCLGCHMPSNQCAARLFCPSMRGVGVNDILVLVLCAKPVHLACCGVLTAWLDKPWVVEPGLLIKAHTAVVPYIMMAFSITGLCFYSGGSGWNVGRQLVLQGLLAWMFWWRCCPALSHRLRPGCAESCWK